MFFLYIDPGTGSMLFSLFIGIAAAGMFAVRTAFLKLRFLLSGGKARGNVDKKRIPIAIFSDHKRYWNVFKPICDDLERRGVGLVYYTCSSDDPALFEPYSHVRAEYLGERNKPYARMNMLHADIVVATTPGLDVYQWKRSRYVKWYVHIPHTADELLGYRMFGLDFYDAVLLTGEFQMANVRALEEKRLLRQKELVTVGSTYLDAMKKRMDSRPVKEKNIATTVLLAPSWGKSAILSKYGSSIIDALMRTGFNIVIRPHPQTLSAEKDVIEPLLKKYPESDLLHWNYDNDNFSVLAQSDIMITDFSGIILDYIFIFGKPLIFADAEYDTAPYDAAWFEETNWRLRILPEIGTPLDEKDFPRMREVIEQAIQSKKFDENRQRLSEEAWQNKGKAAQFVADYLIHKSAQIKEA